jgi:hypothetical protein
MVCELLKREAFWTVAQKPGRSLNRGMYITNGHV